jgi:diacylglycerol kinase family enzyme
VRAAVQARGGEGWHLDVQLTWEAGDAQRLAHEALKAGYSALIVDGGDGTLRDVAEAMVLANTSASVVVLPLGTANDLPAPPVRRLNP